MNIVKEARAYLNQKHDTVEVNRHFAEALTENYENVKDDIDPEVVMYQYDTMSPKTAIWAIAQNYGTMDETDFEDPTRSIPMLESTQILEAIAHRIIEK